MRRKLVDEEKELKRLQSIEAARLRQQAALDAAAAVYMEEKKKVDRSFLFHTTIRLFKCCLTF